MAKRWNASEYDQGHSYVWQKAADLVELLNPRPGERILDVGCGTGHLTAEIAKRGAKVTGMDASADMIVRAKAAYPKFEFFVGDVTQFDFGPPQDAVFSNATLHWVKQAEGAVRCIHAALRPGGRFVAEFGGKGNVKCVSGAIAVGMRAVGAASFDEVDPWYFPSVAEYAGLLERVGFEVTFATLFDRPTAVEGGMRAWVEMFGTPFLERIPPTRRDQFMASAESAAKGLESGGKWFADYRRLRVVAIRH